MSAEKPLSPELDADRLHSAAIHLLRKLRRTDTATGLNAPRLSALSVIVFAGPITLGKLAEAEQVRPPTMTRIVHALEQQGLIEKTRAAQDRRTIRLCATAKGQRLLLLGRHRRIQALTSQIQTLSLTEQQTLHHAIAILEKLTQSP